MALDTRLHRRGFCCGLLGVALVGGVARAQGDAVTTQVLAHGQADCAEALGGPAEVYTIQAALEPGAQLDWHLHPGPVTAVVTKGELTMHHSNGCQTPYKAGDAVFVQPGVVHFERNEGGDVLEFVATFVVPPGSPLRVEAALAGAACPS